MDSSLSREQIHELALTIWNMPHSMRETPQAIEKAIATALWLNGTAKYEASQGRIWPPAQTWPWPPSQRFDSATFEQEVLNALRAIDTRQRNGGVLASEFTHRSLELLRSISDKEEQMTLSIQGITEQISALQAQLIALQTQLTNQNTAVAALQTSVDAEIAAVNAYIANLQAQIASGAGITQDLDGLATQIQTMGTNVATAVSDVQANTTAVDTDQASVDGETSKINQEAGTGAAPAGGTAPAPLTPATGTATITPGGGTVHGQ